MENFQKTPLGVVSSNGFSVEFRGSPGITYIKGGNTIRVDSEYITKPLGVLLYKSTKKNIDADYNDAMFVDIAKALDFLGYYVEIWTDGVPPTG